MHPAGTDIRFYEQIDFKVLRSAIVQFHGTCEIFDKFGIVVGAQQSGASNHIGTF